MDVRLWLGRWRRLSKDYEFLIETSETVVRVAMIGLMARRLAVKRVFGHAPRWSFSGSCEDSASKRSIAQHSVPANSYRFDWDFLPFRRFA